MELVAAQSAELSGVETALVILGLVLAVSAAVITNVVLAVRNRREVALTARITDLEQRIQEAQACIAESLSQFGFGRVLIGLVETGQPTPEARQAYVDSALLRYAQSGLSLVGYAAGPDDPRPAPELPAAVAVQQAYLAARGANHSAGGNYAAAIGGLVEAVEETRVHVVQRVNADAAERRSVTEQREEHQQRSAAIWHVGASVQIVSLVAVAAKDLV